MTRVARTWVSFQRPSAGASVALEHGECHGVSPGQRLRVCRIDAMTRRDQKRPQRLLALRKRVWLADSTERGLECD